MLTFPVEGSSGRFKASARITSVTRKSVYEAGNPDTDVLEVMLESVGPLFAVTQGGATFNVACDMYSDDEYAEFYGSYTLPLSSISLVQVDSGEEYAGKGNLDHAPLTPIEEMGNTFVYTLVLRVTDVEEYLGTSIGRAITLVPRVGSSVVLQSYLAELLFASSAVKAMIASIGVGSDGLGVTINANGEDLDVASGYIITDDNFVSCDGETVVLDYANVDANSYVIIALYVDTLTGSFEVSYGESSETIEGVGEAPWSVNAWDTNLVSAILSNVTDEYGEVTESVVEGTIVTAP